MLFSMRFSLFSSGALTAKPYAFLARPWELQSRSLLDPLDSLGTPIRLDLRGFVPMRLLPRLDPGNPLGEWISDRTRFSYDGFRRQRLATPLFRPVLSLLPLVPISWQCSLDALATILRAGPPTLVAGPLLSFGAFWVQQQLGASLGLRPLAVLPQPSPPLAASDLAQCDLVLLAGCDLRLRLPLLYLRVRRLGLAGVPLVRWGVPGTVGLSLGHRPGILLRLVQGRHRASPLLATARSPLILVGEVPFSVLLLLESRYSGSIRSAAFSPLAPSASFLAGSPLLLPPALASPSPLWLLGADGWDWSRSVPAVIYQGHHGDRAASRASLVLPSRFSLEELDSRRDLWGTVHSPGSLPPNPPLPAALQLLTAAGLLLDPPVLFSTPPRSWLAGLVPRLVFPLLAPLCLGGSPFYPVPANPYRLDVVSRSSRPLALAAIRLVSLAPNYPIFP